MGWMYVDCPECTTEDKCVTMTNLGSGWGHYLCVTCGCLFRSTNDGYVKVASNVEGGTVWPKVWDDIEQLEQAEKKVCLVK